ncbi:MAG: MBL fold metallo-hydrolase [Acetobacteraceae bacterium]|nr:MBL fold metallo-hydrolase [Acetobacteraceae bacterium]
MSLSFLREDPLPPGEAAELLPGVRRLLCDNPGLYTFRGTNTWIIGRGRVAVLDPGPADPAHLAAILAAIRGERVAAILVSHTHRDHSAGAAALARATGAPTFGFGPHRTGREHGEEGADHAFAPEVRLADGAVLEEEGWRLTALHTPGHCANHLCFALEPACVLFSADHVMGWSTSIVSPPDGDMAAYMASLARVAARPERLFLPGHGPPVPEPQSFAEALLAHRRRREALVLEALAAAGEATAEALVPPVYGPALDPRLAPAAARSLLAHLIKLEAEGRAARHGPLWRAA